jgi:hypothetical protein
VENGVVRIFPTLMDETVFRLTGILHESVAIEAAIAIDLGQGALNIGPNRMNERTIFWYVRNMRPS